MISNCMVVTFSPSFRDQTLSIFGATCQFCTSILAYRMNKDSAVTCTTNLLTKGCRKCQVGIYNCKIHYPFKTYCQPVIFWWISSDIALSTSILLDSLWVGLGLVYIVSFCQSSTWSCSIGTSRSWHAYLGINYTNTAGIDCIMCCTFLTI